jgi:hypothetical protein
MSTHPRLAPETQLFVIEAAVKLAQRGFNSKASAVMSLRRKFRVAGAEADALLDRAGCIYDSALAIVAAVREDLLTLYARTKKVAPQEIDYLLPKLASEFPDWSHASLRVALWSAAVFHLR